MYLDQPGGATQPHSHPDSVMVTLSTFQRRLRSGDREVDVELPGFQARWLGAQEHAGTNTGSTPTHTIFVELKEPTRSGSPGDRLRALSALTPWPDPAAQCHVEVVLSISALRPPGQRQVRMSPCARGWIGRRPWAIGEDPAGSGSGEESVCADVSDPPCAVPVHEDVGESMEQSLVCPGRNGI